MSVNAERTGLREEIEALALPLSAVLAMCAFGAACVAAGRTVALPLTRTDAFLWSVHLLLGLPAIIAGLEATWTFVFERPARGDGLRRRIVVVCFIVAGAATAAAGMGVGRAGFCAVMPFATGLFLAVLAVHLRRRAFVTVFSVLVIAASSAGMAAVAILLARKLV